MKFGTQLQDAISPEWQDAYIDYDGLKKKLRKAEKDNPFSEKDETIFVEMLDNNLEKVYAFHQEKMDDIKTRLDYWSETIQTQLPSENNIEEMGHIQDNINNIADDINRLAKYSRINYTGFLKIVKKHDRHTKYVLRPMFMVRLNQCPFWNEDNDALLLKLSQLFAQVRQGGKQMSFQPSSFAGNNNNNIYVEHQPSNNDNTKTIVKRYFVQKENVLELKTYVLRHLPVLVYRDNTGKKENIDPPISSLYLDNADLDIYNSRVELAQGSQIIRIRWYGSANRNNAISIERRTLSEENCGELKDKFTIKDKYIDDFLQGGHAYIDKYTNKLRNTPGKTDEDVEKYTALVTQVQKYIIDNKLHPVLRTYYKRTAFQIPGDKSVRMALDTDLCFIREDSNNMFDQVTRIPEGQWRRPDVDTQYPFADAADTDINRYPFATFEIKLELRPGEAQPEWVTDLQDSGILEETADFSKFVHGVAIMFDTRVALLPYWLAQMGDDLNELPVLPSQSPSVVSRTHQQPIHTTSYSSHDYNNNENVNENTSLLNNKKGASSSATYTTFPRLHDFEPNTSHSDEHTNIGASSIHKFIHFIQHIFFGGNSNVNNNFKQQQQQVPIILPPGVKVPKKVITPLRVEPKVFFANERTYFSWMSFGTLMATFSIALFNGGDAVGKISGIIYTLISLSTLLYGMGLYYRRRELICQRAAGPYDDLTGPTVICFALVFAVGLNAYLKFTVREPSLHNL